MKFINSFSFIFSPRPGTVAENLDLIERKISVERLEKIQNILFENQIKMNKSLENKVVDVLVENLTDDKSKALLDKIIQNLSAENSASSIFTPWTQASDDLEFQFDDMLDYDLK